MPTLMPYVECAECEFVFGAATTGEPEPMHWDECPGCESTDFRFVGE